MKMLMTNKRICGCSIPVFIACVAISLGYLTRNLGVFRNVYDTPTFQRKHNSCRSLAGTDVKAKSCEDFRFVSENIILSGHGDIYRYMFPEGTRSPPIHHLIAVDLSTERLKELPLTEFPKNMEFRPQGIDVRGNRLYVVSHAQNHTERIEVFEISNPSSIERIALKWLQAIEPQVPKGTVNSVTAVSDDEIYITQWLPIGLPIDGLDHPRTNKEIMDVLRGYTELVGARVLGLPPLSFGNTGVHRCTLRTGQCQKVLSRFVSANGIVSSPDSKLVFVTDSMMDFVAVFAREVTTGELTLKTIGRTPYNIDNVMLNPKPSVDGTYELWMGTMPDWVHYLTKTEGNAGGLLVGKYNPFTNSLTFKDYFTHDGSIISGISAAAKWTNLVILSGPKFKGGIVACDVEADRES